MSQILVSNKFLIKKIRERLVLQLKIIYFIKLISVLTLSQARPVNAVKSVNSLSISGIKDSGPSPGGGHHFSDSQTFGDMKDSGPSPGSNNGVVTDLHN
ncbi:hypothetical protein NMG60_11005918 [Bertholletia excelsa]